MVLYQDRLKLENGDIKQCKTHNLRLIEPENEELKVPNVKFSSIINMPSSDFRRLFVIWEEYLKRSR